MLSNIEYLPIKNDFRIGDIKNLAVATNQKDAMSKMYPKGQTSSVSNADMLSQSFGGISVQNNSIPVQEPVQVSSIPNVQNSFNMESNPVDLNTVSSPAPSIDIPKVEPIVTNVEPILNTVPDLNIPSLENVNNESVPTVDSTNNIPVIEPIIPNNTNNNGGIDSGFKVSNEPNIFDNPMSATPFSISQEEINKPLDVNVVNDGNLQQETVSNSMFAEKTDIKPVEGQENGAITNDSINDDIILAQITIEESNVKHYEALAENSRKKIELLKRQIKNVNKEESNLENTASNLFNNNGVLDDEKVLGKTPLPFVNAA